MNYAFRQKKLAASMEEAHLDALLISHMPNIRYLCGFTGSSGVLVVYAGARSPRLTLFTDGRYRQQAKQEVERARVMIESRSSLVAAADALHAAKVSSVGFEAEHLSFAAHHQIQQVLKGRARLKAVRGMVGELRTVKDQDEVELIRSAAVLGTKLLQPALKSIAPGVLETSVAGELEIAARKAGAEGMSFDTIVAAGARSALPHGRASTQPVPDAGFIILDYGVILAGYCSDMTRTVHVGRASASHRRMYEAVLEAQLASIDAVRPGVQAGEADRAGRQVLKKAGYASYFTHSTGHGVGLEVHEPPRLARDETQSLSPGMVVTVEPGIYIPGEGGVRIEDMVLVTETGNEVLTPTAKGLIEL